MTEKVFYPRAPRTEPRSAEPFAGTDREGMPVDLITAEESALRRLSPARNRWRSVAEFDERVVELEGQARRVQEEMQAQPEQLAQPKTRDRERMADWVGSGSEGATPESEATRREEQVEELQRRLEGVNHQISRVLGENAAHVGPPCHLESSGRANRRRRHALSTEPPCATLHILKVYTAANRHSGIGSPMPAVPFIAASASSALWSPSTRIIRASCSPFAVRPARGG